MRLFVGLGNPGAKYAANRHNIGFMAIDEIARRHRFAPWRARFQGQVGEGVIGEEGVMLLKPQTFMNDSGQSVGEAMRFFKLGLGDISVFHDELDLAPAKMRVKVGGGNAGHNGLRSMDRMLGTPEYWRVRLGIGHPGHKDKVHGHVLGNFAKVDEEWLTTLLAAVGDAAPLLAQDKPEDFMTRVALLTNAAGLNPPSP